MDLSSCDAPFVCSCMRALACMCVCVEMELSLCGGVGAVVVGGGWGEAWYGLIFESQRSHT